MPLVDILIWLLVLGTILYLVNNFLPLDPPVKTIINVVVVIVLCLWLLGFTGIGGVTVPIHRRY